jgi:dolichol-phosphate mannosyltransferase
MTETAHTSPGSDQPPCVRVAIVVPLANEEVTVTDFLERVLKQLGTGDLVFGVLDSVTRDNTLAKVEASAKLDARIRPVWAPENRSVVDAYFRGYREAMASGAEWILEMDGGMSHRPEEIPRFLNLIDQGYDYVGGCRFMKGGSHVGSLRRRLVSRSGSILARLTLGTRMRDMTSGFEMFSRRAMEQVLKCGVHSRANFFQSEIKYLLRDWRWIEVPINYRSTNSRVAAGSIREALGNLWKLRGRPGADKGPS